MYHCSTFEKNEIEKFGILIFDVLFIRDLRIIFSFIYHILYKDLHNNIIYSVSAYKHVQFHFPMCEYKPHYIMLFKGKKKRREKKIEITL